MKPNLHIHRSRIRRENNEGRIATCIKMNISHPRIVELAGLAGAHSIWLCNEHVPNDWNQLENCIRAAKLFDMDAIVRVNKGSYSDYLKPFEADAAAIMVPHISSAEEARHVVDMCRFLPLGHRAMDGGNMDGKYCQIPPAEYIELSNHEKMIILQIESPEGVENVEEIAAVAGFDMLLFGPGDFSHRIGKPGQINEPEVHAARARVEKAAREHGKKSFSVAAPGTPRELFARGYAVAQPSADVIALGAGFRSGLEAFQSTKPNPVTSIYGQ
jgi:4-hydroxy-2-oxoheptanedioate aldolase